MSTGRRGAHDRRKWYASSVQALQLGGRRSITRRQDVRRVHGSEDSQRNRRQADCGRVPGTANYNRRGAWPTDALARIVDVLAALREARPYCPVAVQERIDATI